jgi:hypothetical protein
LQNVYGYASFDSREAPRAEPFPDAVLADGPPARMIDSAHDLIAELPWAIMSLKHDPNGVALADGPGWTRIETKSGEFHHRLMTLRGNTATAAGLVRDLRIRSNRCRRPWSCRKDFDPDGPSPRNNKAATREYLDRAKGVLALVMEAGRESPYEDFADRIKAYQRVLERKVSANLKESEALAVPGQACNMATKRSAEQDAGERPAKRPAKRPSTTIAGSDAPPASDRRYDSRPHDDRDARG